VNETKNKLATRDAKLTEFKGKYMIHRDQTGKPGFAGTGIIRNWMRSQALTVSNKKRYERVAAQLAAGYLKAVKNGETAPKQWINS
jgi:hypothetical protein